VEFGYTRSDDQIFAKGRRPLPRQARKSIPKFKSVQYCSHCRRRDRAGTLTIRSMSVFDSINAPGLLNILRISIRSFYVRPSSLLTFAAMVGVEVDCGRSPNASA
jgi:hypothetical protein